VGTHGDKTFEGIAQSFEYLKQNQVDIVPVSNLLTPKGIPRLTHESGN